MRHIEEMANYVSIQIKYLTENSKYFSLVVDESHDLTDDA